MYNHQHRHGGLFIAPWWRFLGTGEATPLPSLFKRLYGPVLKSGRIVAGLHTQRVAR
jgi:hypothetical protein